MINSTEMLVGSPLLIDVPVSDVFAECVGSYRPSKGLQKRIDYVWSNTLERRPDQYDGSLCRLAGIEIDGTGVSLKCERTSFAQYIGTRMENSLDGFEDARADPLGLTVLVMASDESLLVTRRAATAEQNPSSLYFVGGYLEPPKTGSKVQLSAEAVREVKEEIGITLAESDLHLLGIGYDNEFFHPEAFFLGFVNLSPEEIMMAARSAQDAHELDKYIFFSRQEFASLGSSKIVGSSWSFDTALSLFRSASRSTSAILPA